MGIKTEKGNDDDCDGDDKDEGNVNGNAIDELNKILLRYSFVCST